MTHRFERYIETAKANGEDMAKIRKDVIKKALVNGEFHEVTVTSYVNYMYRTKTLPDDQAIQEIFYCLPDKSTAAYIDMKNPNRLIISPFHGKKYTVYLKPEEAPVLEKLDGKPATEDQKLILQQITRIDTSNLEITEYVARALLHQAYQGISIYSMVEKLAGVQSK